MTNHLTDEQLAAFLDGHLDDDDRSAVIEHLDSCPRCFEWVAEIAATLAEAPEPIAAASPAGAIAETPAVDTPSRSGWWTLIAASLAVAVGLALWPRPTTVELVADALGSPAAELSALATRGAEGGLAGFAGRSRPAAGVLAGAGELELELARRAGGSLESQCLPLQALVDSALECADRRAVAAALDQAFGREDLDLGRWLAGARLAALTHDRRFFTEIERPRLERVGGLADVPLERAALGRAIERFSEAPDDDSLDAVARSIDELLAVL